jgi:hypothetical protein
MSTIIIVGCPFMSSSMINMRVSWLKNNNPLAKVLLILEYMLAFISLDPLVIRKLFFPEKS